MKDTLKAGGVMGEKGLKLLYENIIKYNIYPISLSPFPPYYIYNII